MLGYILRRLVQMLVTLFVISVISFVIIQLPPGDYLTSYIASLAATGETVDQATIEALRKQYGLDLPIYVQYFKWLWGILHGDFGYSFSWNRPVSELLWGRLGLSVLVSTVAVIFSWVSGFLIGMYSATHQYSIGDYLATFLGYIGLATPNFLLALVLLWLVYSTTGVNLGGLFSPQYLDAPWSFANLWTC